MRKLERDQLFIVLLVFFGLPAFLPGSANPFASSTALAESDHIKISNEASNYSPDIARPLLSGASPITIDNNVYIQQNAGKSWSLSSPDADTLRFELHRGDHWSSSSWTDPSTSERDEISGQTVYPAGTQINIAYDLMIEPGQTNSASGPGRWLVLSQMHEYNVPNSPPLAIELINGDHMAINIGTHNPIYVYIDPTPIQRGHYYSMAIEVRFSNNGNGLLRVRRDGVNIVEYRGSIGTGVGTYWKQGIYRSSVSENVAVSFRGLKITSVPIVTAIRASLANGADANGKTVAVTLNMSDTVTVSGKPILVLGNGETAVYTDGSGSNELVFSVQAGTGDASSPIPEIMGIDLPNGATVKNALGATADLSMASITRSNLQLDKRAAGGESHRANP